MSRAQATIAAGLARSAAGTAADELIKLGLIQASPATESKGTRGRPSLELSIRPDGAAVIAVQLHRDKVDLAVVDLGRNFLHRETHDLDVVALGPEPTIRRVAALVMQLKEAMPQARLCGVGFSVPGMAGREDGIAHAVLSLGWREVPLAKIMSPLLPSYMPLALGHDATLGALAEFRAGAGRGAHRLLFITAEPGGVGAAMITSAQEMGQVVDHALQAGHLIVDPHGPLCLCGSRGCLELFVDGRAIGAKLGLDDDSRPEEVRQRFFALSRVTADELGLDETLDSLKVGLISLVNTLSPDRVVLSGLLTPFTRLYADELASAMKLAVVAQVGQVEIAVSVLDDAVLLGASEAAFEPLMADPAAFLAAAASAPNAPAHPQEAVQNP